MKILLTAVNAKYIHSNLAVYSLKAYCRAYQAYLELAEYTINQQKDEVLRDIYKRHPDVICFSCYIWNISFIREVIGDLHKLLPEADIWMGGPEVSYDVQKVLQSQPEVLGVLRGEGEETFRELVEMYLHLASDENVLQIATKQKQFWDASLKKEKLRSIKGIAYQGEDAVVQTEDREILDMNQLVFPYEDISLFSNKIVYYESSRGCPFSCSYCLSSIDKTLRFKRVEMVKKELAFFLENRVPQVKFVDRTFNCREEHTLEIWQYLKEHDNQITNFHFEIAADLLTEKEIKVLHTLRPGLIQLEIGVQSTNPNTLREIRRKTDFAKIAWATKQIQQGQNVHQHLDLIAGLPYEGYERFAESFEQVYALKPQQLQLGFLKVLKGSYMAEKAAVYGCVYKTKEPYEVLKTNWLSYKEICRLKGIEDMVEVYYNSGQFSRTMETLEKEFPNAFSMYEALADFYEAKGYFGLSHARIRRYELLREFIREQDLPNPELFDARMVFDLYARENLKTRPVWAEDQKMHKAWIQEFYQSEEQEPKLLKDYQGYTAKQMEKMTHLEVFAYDVLGQGTKKGSYPVLFTYQKRNPLTRDAEFFVLQKGKAPEAEENV